MFVLLEKFALKNVLVFFFSPSLESALQYFGRMFGADGVGFWDQTTSFFLRERILLLIIAALLCSPTVKNFHDSTVYRKGGAAKAVSVVLYVALFVVCVAGLVSATYTSFLYVQF